MIILNKENSNHFVYESLKNRLRLLLKDLETRYVMKTCVCDTKNLEEVEKLAESSGDFTKQSKKIKKLRNDFQILTKLLENIKKTTYNDFNYSCLYDIGEKIIMKQSLLNSLEKRHTFICHSLNHELEQPQDKFDFSSPNCCKMGDCKSNSSLQMKEKLFGLKHKCDKLRTKQRNMLNLCTNNPMYLETYANNYSNYYKDLLQLYADRIEAMSDLCAKYKRIIKKKDETTSSISLERYDRCRRSANDITFDMSTLTSELKQINIKLQKEVENIELAMKKLKFS